MEDGAELDRAYNGEQLDDKLLLLKAFVARCFCGIFSGFSSYDSVSYVW